MVRSKTSTSAATRRHAAQAEQEAARREREAAQFGLDSVYEDPDDLRRGESGMDAYVDDGDYAQDGRITQQDLQDMEERGGLAPWERADLTRAQYKRYRNSGVKLRDFKAKLQGRKHEIHVSLAGSIVLGPYAQQHDTFLVADNTADQNNLTGNDILFQIARQVNVNPGRPMGQGFLEVGFGVAPWAEIGLMMGIRGGPYDWRVYKEVQGLQNEVPTEYNRDRATTPAFGFQVGFMPGPSWPVRPRFQIGASYQPGAKLTKYVQIPGFLVSSQFKPIHNVVLHLRLLGLEVNAGKWVLIWARSEVDLTVFDFGRTVVPGISRGDSNALSNEAKDAFGAIGRASPLGFGGSLGITIRFRTGGLK